MTTSAHYLSSSKMMPPLAATQEVERTALVNTLNTQENTRKLTVFQAPAGYGKSTTMRQILARCRLQGVITIWLNFDEADNDVSRFLAAFSQAVAPHSPQLEHELHQQMRNEELAHRIIESLNDISHPTTIFFDNVETINNPAVTGLIARGIEALPENCRVFVGSRTAPPIGLAKMAARGQLTDIQADSLRFSKDEAADLFFQKFENSLTRAQIQKLHKSTDGWPAALKLAEFALEGDSSTERVIANFSGTNAAVAAYLAEEVLASLSQEIQDFLLQSCIFEEIDVEICNQVLQREDSRAVLTDLQRRNLFVAASDEHEQLFRYHSLFRDFLHNQSLRRQPKLLEQLHRAASQAYLDRNRPIPAIRHALKSQDMPLALTLLREHADRLVSQGRIGLLTHLLSLVPHPQLDQHLHLKLIYALCMTYTRGPKPAYELLIDMDENDLPPGPSAYLLALRPMQLAMMDRIAEAHTQGIEASSRVGDDTPNARIVLAQALAQTSIILGEHDKAHNYCDQARCGPNSEVDIFNMVLAESAESGMDLMAGHLRQAYQRIKVALPDHGIPENRNGRGITMASIQLAEMLYEQDECEQARRLLLTNSALVQDMGPPDSLITASVILSRIVDSEGDYEYALQLLIELENSGHRLSLPRVIASARLERSRLWLAHGDKQGALEQLKLAQRCFDWKSTEDFWFVSNDTLTPDITYLRWLVRTGDIRKALPLARNQLKAAERAQRARRALKIRILLAEALFVSGDKNSARRTINEALDLAEQEGFVRTFLEEGPSLTPLFRDMGISEIPFRSTHNATPTEQSATPIQATAQQAIAAMPEEDRLTNKEMKVLSVLALGMSNIAIAEQLYVSESTVRTHLRNINLKLHAKNRTEAVSIARQMGLLG